MQRNSRGIAFLYFVAIVLSVIILASILAASVYRVYIIENSQKAENKANWKTTSVLYNVLVDSSKYCLSKVTSDQLTPDDIAKYSKTVNKYYRSITGKDLGPFQCQVLKKRSLYKKVNINTLELKYHNITLRLNLGGKSYTITYIADVIVSPYNSNQGSMGVSDVRLDVDYQDKLIIKWRESGVYREYRVAIPLKTVYGYAVFKNGETKLNLKVKPVNYEYLWEISTPLILTADLNSINVYIISPSGIHNEIKVFYIEHGNGGG